MAPLCSLITLNSFSSSRGNREDDIMNGKVEEGLRYPYRRCVASVFSSRVSYKLMGLDGSGFLLKLQNIFFYSG